MTHRPSSPKRPRNGADAVPSRSLRMNLGVLVAIVSGVLLAASLAELATVGWKEWEHTTGLVTGQPRLTRRKHHSVVDLAYTYAAAGGRYRETTQVWASSNESGSALMARYRPGTSVPVYYDPRRPERSRLFSSPRESQTGGLIFGMLGVVFGIGYALLFPGGRRAIIRPPGEPR